MDFRTSWKSKNEHFAWEVVKKLNFRINDYPMLIGTDFGSIFGRFGVDFWKKNRSKIDIEVDLELGKWEEAKNGRHKGVCHVRWVLISQPGVPRDAHARGDITIQNVQTTKLPRI